MGVLQKLQRLSLIPCDYEGKFICNDNYYLISMPKYEYNLEMYRNSQIPKTHGLNIQDLFNSISTPVLRLIRNYEMIGEVHGYLHPRNILFNNMPSDNILLSDFQGYNFKEQTELDREWIAPELLFGKEATSATDVWMFGCTLYFIENGKSPIVITGNIYKDFKSPTTEMDKEETYKQQYDNRYGTHNEVIKKMININPIERLSLDAIEKTFNINKNKIMKFNGNQNLLNLIEKKNITKFIYNNYPFQNKEYDLLCDCHPVLLSLLIKELNINPCKIIFIMIMKFLLENEKYYNFVMNRTEVGIFDGIDIKHQFLCIGNIDDEIYLNLLIENIAEFEDLETLHIRSIYHLLSFIIFYSFFLFLFLFFFSHSPSPSPYSSSPCYCYCCCCFCYSSPFSSPSFSPPSPSLYYYYYYYV